MAASLAASEGAALTPLEEYDEGPALLVNVSGGPTGLGIKRKRAPAGSAANPSARHFPCLHEGCGRSFSRELHLTTHTRTHSGEKPFVCAFPDCGAAFARVDNLAEHSRTHTKERPFVCTFEGCNKAFAHHRTLADHVRTHTGAQVCRAWGADLFLQPFLIIYCRRKTLRVPARPLRKGLRAGIALAPSQPSTHRSCREESPCATRLPNHPTCLQAIAPMPVDSRAASRRSRLRPAAPGTSRPVGASSHCRNPSTPPFFLPCCPCRHTRCGPHACRRPACQSWPSLRWQRLPTQPRWFSSRQRLQHLQQRWLGRQRPRLSLQMGMMDVADTRAAAVTSWPFEFKCILHHHWQLPVRPRRVHRPWPLAWHWHIAGHDWFFSRVAAQPGSQAPQRCSRRRHVPCAHLKFQL